jgi:hypothetical protein
MEGTLSFQDLAGASYKGAYGIGSGLDQAAAHFTIFYGCTIFTTSAVNALRVMMSSGNINGIFSLYGVRKV